MKYAAVSFAKLASTSSIACSGWLNMWDEFDVCFSLLLREVFLQVLRFSPLLKKHHFHSICKRVLNMAASVHFVNITTLPYGYET